MSPITMSVPKRASRWRRAVLIALTGLGLFLCLSLIDAWDAMGKSASGPRLARMQASPQWDGEHFENPQPLWNDGWGAFVGMFNASDFVSPDAPVAFLRATERRFRERPESGLRVTWLGHSTMLLEIDGLRILTDPVWGDRTSPLTWLGPARWYPPPLAITDLPHIDAVVISHDHYDHLDHETIRAMRHWDTTFIVPLGVGAHLTYWEVPSTRIIELDWWERTRVRGLEIVCTPARHASGRTGTDYGATLWAGFAMLGPRHRVYYSGDTGLFPALRDIGERLGPFDLTMIEAGQYHAAWPDWHLGPEQTVEAHRMVKGRVLLPVHWGLFGLAYHGWTEPIERVLVESARHDVTVIAPRPGQSIEPEDAPAIERWWPNVPWRTGEQDPIVSTRVH